MPKATAVFLPRYLLVLGTSPLLLPPHLLLVVPPLLPLLLLPQLLLASLLLWGQEAQVSTPTPLHRSSKSFFSQFLGRHLTQQPAMLLTCSGAWRT